MTLERQSLTVRLRPDSAAPDSVNSASVVLGKGTDLETDSDLQVREADEAAKDAPSSDDTFVVNRMGTDEHIPRSISGDGTDSPSQLRSSIDEAERLSQARQSAADRVGADDETVPADPEVLAQEVAQLKAGQEKMMAALTEAQPGAASGGNWLDAATQGMLGSMAGAGGGALLGSVVPGTGTAVGAAVGAAVSGAASDVTKETLAYLDDNRPGGKALELEQMYQEISEMYAELKDEEHMTGLGSDATGLRD